MAAAAAAHRSGVCCSTQVATWVETFFLPSKRCCKVATFPPPLKTSVREIDDLGRVVAEGLGESIGNDCVVYL